jgi:hypothetical protein
VRASSDALKKALREGCLMPLLDRVKRDRTLELEFRPGCADVYYRGGCITKVAPVRAGAYSLSIDPKYFDHAEPAKIRPADSATVCDADGCAAWLANLGRLKDEMDLWFGEHQKWERESQQVLARENNWDSSGTASDYFILDIEYQHPLAKGRFDALAVHWPSRSADRMVGDDRRFAFLELKWGEHALDSGIGAQKPGIRKHVRDLTAFVVSPGFADLKESMITVFNDKLELGLLPRAGRKLVSFSSNIEPQFIIVLANHDPASSKLLDELECLSAEGVSDSIELRFAVANYFGYGLFEERLRSLEEVLLQLRSDPVLRRAQKSLA